MYPQGQPPPQAGWGALDIFVDYFALQWMLAFVTPVVEVDGYALPKPWGRHVIPLAPGMHQLRVYYPYMFSAQSGLAVAIQGLPVYAGMATMARYSAPFWQFSGGDLFVSGTRPL